MGDKRRFDLTAKSIAKQFPDRNLRIADVAGGKGYLNLALRNLGYHDVTTFDKRKPGKRVRTVETQYRFFSEEMAVDYDLIVGLHPDEATDVIVVSACRHDKKFYVVPCCVKPTARTYWGAHKYGLWMDHLKGLASEFNRAVYELRLRYNGKNIALVGR